MITFLTRSILLLFISLLAVIPVRAQEGEVVDQIVAVVNDHIILRSDVDNQLREYMQQTQQTNVDDDMWYQVLESQVFRHMLLEKARMDSIVVSDDHVDRVLDQQINQMLEQAGSEERLEQYFGQSLLEVRAEFREHFREEMLVEEVRNQQMQNVNITRPEVFEFYEDIPEDELPMMPESVELAQIVVEPPPLTEAKENARNFAESLRDSIINYDKEIEELARRYSSGHTASEGGRLPMVDINDLLPSYAAAASALEPGEISEVVETADGFHVIKLNERSGDRISTTHILIELDAEELDEQYAVDKLNALKDSVEAGGEDFSTIARRHSDDKATAPRGGRLTDQQTGQRRIPVERLDSSLRDLISGMEAGEISQPQEFTFGEEDERTGYRIVKVRDKNEERRATIEEDYQMIRQFALQQKQQEHLNEWFENLREDIYVEYRIDMPDVDPQIEMDEPVMDEQQQQQQQPPPQQQQQQPPPPDR